MDHRTIRGRLDYVTDGEGITGKEWFTICIHADGARTLQSMTVMDDDKLLRQSRSRWGPTGGHLIARSASR